MRDLRIAPARQLPAAPRLTLMPGSPAAMPPARPRPATSSAGPRPAASTAGFGSPPSGGPAPPGRWTRTSAGSRPAASCTTTSVPVTLPEPLASLTLRLADERRGHAVTGDQGASRWLFPGGQPGRPISADRLAGRLRQLGLRPDPARSAALFQLATELPAAILARLPGLNIKAAVSGSRSTSSRESSPTPPAASRPCSPRRAPPAAPAQPPRPAGPCTG